jgi:hypothetical protein
VSIWLQFIAESLIEGIGFTFPIWIGLGIAFAVKKVKRQEKLPLAPIVLGVLVVGLALIGNSMRSGDDRTVVEKAAVQPTGMQLAGVSSAKKLLADSSSVQTIVSREPSGGAADADLSQSVLKEIEQRTLVSFRKSMMQELVRRGKTLKPERITAESVYIEKGGRKLAVTKLRADGVTLGVQIAGLVNDEFVRLMCVTDQPKEIEIVTGACAEATNKTFGVSFVETVDG